MIGLKARPRSVASVGTDTRRLLVVDDDRELLPIVRRAARLVLHDLQVDCAPTAEEARSLLSGRAYDVVLLDYYLDGDERGVDLVRLARRSQRDAVIAMMSSTGVRGLLDRTRHDRRLKLLPKPFTAAVVHHFLHDALGLPGLPPAHVPRLA